MHYDDLFEEELKNSRRNFKAERLYYVIEQHAGEATPIKMSVPVSLNDDEVALLRKRLVVVECIPSLEVHRYISEIREGGK